MKKTPATWLTVPDDALAIFGAVLVAIVLNFAVEYFTGFHTGTLQESAPIHYTRTTAEQATAAPVRPDRARSTMNAPWSLWNKSRTISSLLSITSSKTLHDPVLRGGDDVGVFLGIA